MLQIGHLTTPSPSPQWFSDIRREPLVSHWTGANPIQVAPNPGEWMDGSLVGLYSRLMMEHIDCSRSLFLKQNCCVIKSGSISQLKEKEEWWHRSHINMLTTLQGALCTFLSSQPRKHLPSLLPTSFSPAAKPSANGRLINVARKVARNEGRQ